MFRMVFRLSVMVLCSCMLPGCMTRLVTHTPRTALEQMLVTGAADAALEKFDLPVLKDRKVYADFTNLSATDAEYVKVATRARLSQIGAQLVETQADAEYTVEVASGALGTEYKTLNLGIPPFPAPNSPVPTPEISLYKSNRQTGMMKLLIFVHQQGRFVAANQYYARRDRDESFILWWRFHHTDDVRSGWNRAEYRAGSPPS